MSPFEQCHQGHAGDWFGHRVNPEDRILANRCIALDVGITASGNPCDFATATDQRQHTGRFAFGDIGFHELLDTLQTLGGKPRVFGRRSYHVASFIRATSIAFSVASASAREKGSGGRSFKTWP